MVEDADKLVSLVSELKEVGVEFIVMILLLVYFVISLRTMYARHKYTVKKLEELEELIHQEHNSHLKCVKDLAITNIKMETAITNLNDCMKSMRR